MNIKLFEENKDEFDSFKKLYDEYRYSTGQRFMTEEDYRKLKYEITSGSTELYVIEQDGSLVGFMSVQSDGEKGMKVSSMYVASQCRSKGYAKEMVRHVSEIMKLRGIMYISAECEPFYVRKFVRLGFSTEAGRDGRNVIMCTELQSGGAIEAAKAGNVGAAENIKMPEPPKIKTGSFTYVPPVKGSPETETDEGAEKPSDDVPKQNSQADDAEPSPEPQSAQTGQTHMNGGGAWESVKTSGYTGRYEYKNLKKKSGQSKTIALAVVLILFIVISMPLFFMMRSLNTWSTDYADVKEAAEPANVPKPAEPDRQSPPEPADYAPEDEPAEEDLFTQVFNSSQDALGTTIATQWFDFTVQDMRVMVNIPSELKEAGAEKLLAIDMRFENSVEQGIQIPMRAFPIFTSAEMAAVPIENIGMRGQPEDFFLLSDGDMIDAVFYYSLPADFATGILQYVEYGEEGEVMGVYSLKVYIDDFVDSQEELTVYIPEDTTPSDIIGNQQEPQDDAGEDSADQQDDFDIIIVDTDEDDGGHSISFSEGQRIVHLTVFLTNMSDKDVEIIEDTIVLLHSDFASNQVPLGGNPIIESGSMETMDLYFIVPEGTETGTLHFETTTDGYETWTVREETVFMR